MKKILALAMVLCLSLAGCGATPIEKCQQRAVSIGEQFLDFEISEEEAIERLESLRVPETEGNGQLYLDCDIDALAFSIRIGSSYEKIKDRVDSIRDHTYE